MSRMLDCPAAECWQSLLDVNLPAELRDRYESHLNSCPACQDQIDQVLDQQEELLRLAGKIGDPTARPADPTLSRVLQGLHRAKLPERLAPAEPPDLYFLRPSDRPEILGTLGPYEVLEVVGQGGMGVVLKGYEPALRRFVAVKVLASALAGSAAARKRFTREAQSAAAVCHDHIVTVYGVAEAEGLPYLVMQYVAGESLQTRLDRTGPLEAVEVVRIGLQTALGLAAAHARGLIHRDIKPANLLLENGSRVKITDFGLARLIDDVGLTRDGVVAGTPQFMAPEQARGEPIDHRADLFSLGAVLYTMCTGTPPFRGSTTVSVLRQVSDHEADSVRTVNPGTPDWLDALIARLMAKNPVDRVQSAAEVADLLERYLGHLRQPDLPVPELPSRPVADCRRRAEPPVRKGVVPGSVRRFWLPALVLLAVLGSVIAFQLAGGEGAAQPAPAAEYHEYHVPLRGRPENLPTMQIVGPDGEKCVRFEPAGLRITLPTGFAGARPQTGLSTGIVLKGDFEITVNFEILKEPEPEDAGNTTPLSLWVWRVKGDRCITGVSRRVEVDKGPQFSAFSARFEKSSGKTIPTMGTSIPTDAKSGRLRLVRLGGELSYYASEGAEAEFLLLSQFSIGEQDLDDVRVIGFTGGARASLDARVSDLRIRMGSLPRVPAAKADSRGWLGAATALGVGLLLLFGLTLFLRRRRAGAEAPPGAPEEHNPTRAVSSISFACSCGKALRAKAELAGKKVRCQGCGAPILVPDRRDDGSVATPL